VGVATSNLFMESDVDVYIDGEGTASIQTTGTEDWFMSGFYFTAGAGSVPWFFVSLIDTTAHDMNAAVDLLSLFGGIHYSDGIVINWDCTEMTDTTAKISYVVLYYEEAA
ncbi:MAG: DUF2961 domain-containing protein, partial [bacterium]